MDEVREELCAGLGLGWQFSKDRRVRGNIREREGGTDGPSRTEGRTERGRDEGTEGRRDGGTERQRDRRIQEGWRGGGIVYERRKEVH